MSLAGHGPKSESRHICLIIALIGQQGPVLYKGDKGVNDAARPPECGPAEAGSLPASSLPWSIDCLAWMPDSPLNRSPTHTNTQIHTCKCIYTCTHTHTLTYIYLHTYLGSVRGVMVTIVRNGHGDMSSNLDETDCISHSTNTLGKGMNPIILLPARSK